MSLSHNEINNIKKEIVKKAINYYRTKGEEIVEKLDYKNKHHLVLILRYYRKNVNVESKSKLFLNQMISNQKNIPEIKIETETIKKVKLDIKATYETIKKEDKTMTLSDVIKIANKKLEEARNYYKEVIEDERL